MIIWMWAAGALAEPVYHRLYSPEGSATSFLRSNWNKYTENYHPTYALDDNPATAWVEGADGDGIGEVLSWEISPLSQSRSVKLRIRNGYQKSDALLTANSAPKDVVVTLWRGREKVAEKQVTLQRVSGFQEIVIETGGKGLNHIELKVSSVTPGSKYKDTCISDIETWVETDAKYNEAFELAKKSTLSAWIAERLKTAQYFATLPTTWPFAAREFSRDPVTSETEAQFTTLAAPLQAEKERLKASTTWFSAAAQASAPTKRPDGLELVEPFVRHVRAADVAFFEAKQQEIHKKIVDEEAPDFWTEQWSESFKLDRAPDGALRHSLVRSGHTDEGRITTTHTTEILLAYDAQGRVEKALVTESVNDECSASTDAVHLFRWSADGKIDRVDTHTHERSRCFSAEFKDTYSRTAYHP